MKNIGKKIKFYRNKIGFTQEEMSEKIGISFQSNSKIERNITDVNISRLLQIAKILNISIKDFFSPTKSDTYEEDILKTLAQKNEEIIKLQKQVITLLAKNNNSK